MADETVQPECPDNDAAGHPDDALALERARVLLERGDYGLVLRTLEPLAERHAPGSLIGAELRLQLATALIGQGRSEEAFHWCGGLQACADPDLRARARELRQILEAPALERPRDWSLSLPDLGNAPPLETLAAASGAVRRSRRPEPPPPPPVGPTRAPLGFAALAGLLLLLLLLASMLGGCVEVRTELRFAGPGRLQVSHELRSLSGTPGPWQQRLAARLAGAGFHASRSGGLTRLEGGVLPAEAALEELAASFREAAVLADLPLPLPSIDFHERNWLLGVRQHLSFSIDLRDLPPLPGLALSIDLHPLGQRGLDRAEPLAPERSGPGHLRWPLQPGQINTLSVHGWRWSPLGLGSMAIALLLPLVLLLQRLRRQLGFGLPELPA